MSYNEEVKIIIFQPRGLSGIKGPEGRFALPAAGAVLPDHLSVVIPGKNTEEKKIPKIDQSEFH